jgi:hypothetical protein
MDKTRIVVVFVTIITAVKTKSECSDEYTNDHLTDLGYGNEHCIQPSRLHPNSQEKIVTIHHGIHGVVHNHEEKAAGGLTNVRMPAVKKCSDMVILVQKQQKLLMHNYKESIKNVLLCSF